MSAARRWPGVAPLVGFFALAFVLSWGVGAVFKGVPIVSPDGLFIGGVSLAAIIVLAVTEGRPGLRDLGHRLVRWRVGARWYAVLIAVPILVVGAADRFSFHCSGALRWTGRGGRAGRPRRCCWGFCSFFRWAPRSGRRSAGAGMRSRGC